MQLSGDELDAIGMVLTYACLSDNFAFYVTRGTAGRQYTINYATPYCTNEGVEWSAPVLAMQHMGGLLTQTPRPTLYLGNGAQLGNAGEGMRGFFELRTTRHYHKERYFPWMERDIGWYMTDWELAGFEPIDPTAILHRPQLNDFIPGNLGPVPYVNVDYNLESRHLHRLYMALAFHRVRRKFDLNETGHKIAALLVDRMYGRVCAIAHNTRGDNPTFHAEVNLVQAYLNAQPYYRNGPFMLYSTLQPCPMCAAMIAEYLPDAIVFYGQGDAGKHMDALDYVETPRFYLPLNDHWDHHGRVKLLRNWGAEKENKRAGNHFEQQGRFQGNGSDMYIYLGDLHGQLSKPKGRTVSHRTSLTRNLNDPLFEKRIRNAARTLDRKMNQYIHGGKPEPHYADEIRYDRYRSIMQIMTHIGPLIEQV